jgi:hypothetical protein
MSANRGSRHIVDPAFIQEDINPRDILFALRLLSAEIIQAPLPGDLHSRAASVIEIGFAVFELRPVVRSLLSSCIVLSEDLYATEYRLLQEC